MNTCPNCYYNIRVDTLNTSCDDKRHTQSTNRVYNITEGKDNKYKFEYWPFKFPDSPARPNDYRNPTYPLDNRYANILYAIAQLIGERHNSSYSYGNPISAFVRFFHDVNLLSTKIYFDENETSNTPINPDLSVGLDLLILGAVLYAILIRLIDRIFTLNRLRMGAEKRYIFATENPEIAPPTTPSLKDEEQPTQDDTDRAYTHMLNLVNTYTVADGNISGQIADTMSKGKVGRIPNAHVDMIVSIAHYADTMGVPMSENSPHINKKNVYARLWITRHASPIDTLCKILHIQKYLRNNQQGNASYEWVYTDPLSHTIDAALCELVRIDEHQQLASGN